jgi:hypothetical protein
MSSRTSVRNLIEASSRTVPRQVPIGTRSGGPEPVPRPVPRPVPDRSRTGPRTRSGHPVRTRSGPGPDPEYPEYSEKSDEFVEISEKSGLRDPCQCTELTSPSESGPDSGFGTEISVNFRKFWSRTGSEPGPDRVPDWVPIWVPNRSPDRSRTGPRTGPPVRVRKVGPDRSRIGSRTGPRTGSGSRSGSGPDYINII